MSLTKLVLLGALCLTTLGSCVRQTTKYRIALIPKGMTHEFWQSIHRGAQRAASDIEQKQKITTQIIWDGPLKENDNLAQIRIMDRRISTGVDGIILAPQHSQILVAPVERAVERRIPVLIIDSGLAREDLLLQYAATNNYNGGRLAAEKMLEVLRQEGKTAPNIIMLRYQVGSQSTEQREKGFEDLIDETIREQKAAGKKTITWLSRNKYSGATKDSALKEAAPLINSLKQKGIDAIFAPNESSTNGVLDALRSMDLNHKVRLFGFDSSAPLLQAMREGDVDGLVLQDPYRMGYLAVWSLVHSLEGHDVNSKGKTIGTGERMITLANLDSLSTLELFDPKLQAKRIVEVPHYALLGAIK